MAKLNATFVMEQHLGHGTFYQNLRQAFSGNAHLDATWVEVTYANSGTWWEKIPLLPAHLRGTLTGRSQVRHGLHCRPQDVTFFNTQVPAALAGRLVQAQPYVLCTDITPVQYNALRDYYTQQPDALSFIERYKHRVNRRLLQRAAHLIPWSHWVRRSLIADYDVQPARITVVPPGVDMQKWRPATTSGAHRVPRILFVGGDFLRKGGDTLLRAFQQLPPGSAELILVTRSAIEPTTGITVRNDLHANSPELIALYQSCDIFVLPTRAEAFGIAAVEASATGLPVIATAVGGVPDIVKDGVTGLLIQPDEVTQLTAALTRLLSDPALRQRLGTAARQHVERDFDLTKNAAKVLQILKEAVNQ